MATNTKITKPTPALIAELQAMSWPSTNAGRMYLKRRGTTADKLGLIFGMAPEGREGIALYPAAQAGPPAGKKAKPAKPAEALVSDDAAFETFAGQVDAQLVAKREEPVADAELRDFFDRGIEAQLAVNAIIGARTAALEKVTAQPEPAAQPAPKAKRGKAAQPPAEAPTPAPAAAIEPTPAIAPESTPAIAAPATALPGQVILLLGDPMDRSAADLWAPKLAKQLGVAIHVCDPATGRAIASIPASQPRAPRPPRAASGGERKNDTLAIVIPLMEREGGLSGEEVRAALNWKTPPGAWYFNHWAEKAGRAADLVDMGKIDGARRFRLTPKAA